MRRLATPERILDLGIRFGPYGGKLKPFAKGLTLKKVKNAVHGMDLGALKSCLPERLCTEDKRIRLAPEAFLKDIERVREKFLRSETINLERNGKLVLIGRRQLRSNNSWMHNSARLVKGKPQCTVLMHPDDADQRKLNSGQNVVIKSSVGSIVLLLEVSDEMMPGVVSIPHGWGHDRSSTQLRIAEEHAGASINDLISNQAIDALSGTAAFNGIFVIVERQN